MRARRSILGAVFRVDLLYFSAIMLPVILKKCVPAFVSTELANVKTSVVRTRVCRTTFHFRVNVWQNYLPMVSVFLEFIQFMSISLLMQ